MKKFSEINFLDIEENNEYKNTIDSVLEKAFKTEKLDKSNIYINIILTTPENIRKANREYRNIDKETDVL